MPYTAHRLDPNHSQNLGDYGIVRRYTRNGYEDSQLYHYNSEIGRLINRSAWHMPVISCGSRIYKGCMKAIERLESEENKAVTSAKHQD